MLGCFIGQRCHMQTAHGHIYSSLTITVGYLIRSKRIRDIHLDAHKVGCVIQRQFLHMLVLNLHLVLIGEICGKGRESQRGKQRIFYGPPVRAFRLLQRRQYHLNFHHSIFVILHSSFYILHYSLYHFTFNDTYINTAKITKMPMLPNNKA